MKKLLLLSIFLIIILNASQSPTQQSIVHGRVLSQKNHQILQGAQIFLYNKNGFQLKAVTDSSGSFQIETGKQKLKLYAQMAGYENDTLELALSEKNLDQQIVLSLKSYQGKEVVKTASSKQPIISPIHKKLKLRSNNSSFFLSDPIRQLSSLSGVTYTNDFSSTLFIRGSSDYQCLVSFNDIPVLFPYHLGGIFSMFSGNAVSSVSFSPGIYSAEYSGYLGGRVNIQPEYHSEKNKYHNKISLGLLSSSIFHSNKLSNLEYYLSYRRTYFDLLTEMISSVTFPYYFGDFQSGFTYKISKNQNIEGSILHSQDSWKIGYLKKDNTNDLNWGNRVFGLNYDFNKNHYSINSQIFYTEKFSNYKEDSTLIDNHTIQYGLKSMFKYKFKNVILKVGYSYTSNKYSYNWEFQNNSSIADTIDESINGFFYPGSPSIFERKKIALKHEAFIQTTYFIRDNIKLTPGVNLSYNFLIKNWCVSPRLNLTYELTEQLNLFSTVARHHQYFYTFNQWESKPVSFPFPVFFPVENYDNVLSSNYFSLGGEWSYFKNILISMESYFKKMKNIPKKEEEPPYKIIRNIKYAYGMDLSLDYSRQKKFNLNLAYSLSYLKLKEENKIYPGDNERRHSLKLNLNTKISKSWWFKLKGLYMSGTPYTPRLKYYGSAPVNNKWNNNDWSDPVLSPNYSGLWNVDKLDKNSARIEPYFRLDCGITKKWTLSDSKIIGEIYILNLVYNKNPRAYGYSISNHSTPKKEKRLNLPIVPSIEVSYEF